MRGVQGAVWGVRGVRGVVCVGIVGGATVGGTGRARGCRDVGGTGWTLDPDSG